MIELAAILAVLVAPFALGWYGGRRLVARDPIAKASFGRMVQWTSVIYGALALAAIALCLAGRSQAREVWSCMACPVFAAGPLVGLMLVGVADSIMRGRPETACPWCGYDLKGSPSGRCPECGEDAAASQRSSLRP